jgi:energy-coupling factor transporter ATP-binding protein EcfA2
VQIAVNITSIEFRNYKAFKLYSLALQKMSLLVGPNNCGKSTVVDALKILSVAIRKARAKKPDFLMGPIGPVHGYEISPDVVAVSLENSHTDYSDAEATISFRLSNSNRLELYFPKGGGCRLIPIPQARRVTTVAAFKSEFPVTVAVVPVLGRVEHEERLVERETVQRNIESHLASRHFRNYWYYYPANFAEFGELVANTWPGMQILRPELINDRPQRLSMFCRENRILRELFWAGSGFQVWCQLLTHVVNGRGSTLFVVDEPEIYLHPDVQRQLVGILRRGGSDIVMASHSPEIIGEADPSEIVLVDKRRRAGQRLRDVDAVQTVLDQIGSSQNITLTRLARNRRVLFVEDDYDFGIIRRFAHRLGYAELASGSDVTAVPSSGFSSWERICALGWGIPRTLGRNLLIAAVYDRDYWGDEYIDEVRGKLEACTAFVHFHSRKEIENYLLVPSVFARALTEAVLEKKERGEFKNLALPTEEGVRSLLTEITDSEKSAVQAQYIARRQEFLRRSHSKLDLATAARDTLQILDNKWQTIEERMEIVPGKEVLAALRQRVRELFCVNVSDHRIISSFHLDEIPADLNGLLAGLEGFRNMKPDPTKHEEGASEGDPA